MIHTDEESIYPCSSKRKSTLWGWRCYWTSQVQEGFL